MSLTIQNQIRNIISKIAPCDRIEKLHIQNTLNWIDSGVEIFRLEKPATPPKHLVSYTVFVDKKRGKLLLLEHKKAQLLLPNGGHVDINELPFNTAVREIKEEMNEDAMFLFNTTSPIFITVTETVGITAGHIDVSLWYVFDRDSTLPINDNSEEFKKEFEGYRWYSFSEVLNIDIKKLDPNMHRFTRKLMEALN